MQGVGVGHRAQSLLIFGEQGNQGGQVGRVAVAVHVGLGEADIAVEQYLPEESQVGDVQLCLWPGSLASEDVLGPVRHSQCEAADRQPGKCFQNEAGSEEHRVVGIRSAGHEPGRRLGLGVKFHPLAPEFQGLPVNSRDNPECHHGVAEELPQHGPIG